MSNSAITGFGGGRVVQKVNTNTGALITIANDELIPRDDTIPQITEGAEVLSLAITPTSASNKLRITAVVNASPGGSGYMQAALFKVGTADALDVASTEVGSASLSRQLTIETYVTAGSTSEIVFKLRAGMDATDLLYINGQVAGRLFGGVNITSMTIEEIGPGTGTISNPGNMVAGTSCVQNPVTLSATTDQAHGLSETPVFVNVYYECLSDELGYVTGDRVTSSQKEGAATNGAMAVWDSTNVSIVTNNTAPVFLSRNAGGTTTTISVAKWKLVAVPYVLG